MIGVKDGFEKKMGENGYTLMKKFAGRDPALAGKRIYNISTRRRFHEAFTLIGK